MRLGLSCDFRREHLRSTCTSQIAKLGAHNSCKEEIRGEKFESLPLLHPSFRRNLQDSVVSEALEYSDRENWLRMKANQTDEAGETAPASFD